MSPEQVEGKEVDQRSDIYSLGIILYEMVTGQVPFEGDTPFTIGVKHKSEAPKPPKDLNSDLPDDLSQVILRCLEKDKEKRFQSTEELLSELTNIEKGIPTTERKATKTKSITSKELTVTLSMRKLFIPALIVIALVIAAVVIWQFLPQKKQVPPASEGKPFLAVMYFKNNTGDENLAHLRTMLSDALITDLSQSKYLKVLSGERVFEILRDLNQLGTETYSTDILQEIAVQGGASHALLGNYARIGDVFRIDVIIQRIATGEITGSERVEARGEEDVFPQIDILTKKIKTIFMLTEEEIASDLDKDIGQITTASPKAYNYYIEGTKHLGSDNRRSLSLFEKAVEIDPEFAMAYQKMSIAYWGLGLISERKKFVQKALEFSDRISDKERFMIEGHYYQESERTYDKAIEAYTRLLELYPEGEGNIGLAILYRDIEEWDKAIRLYEVLIKSKNPAIASYRGLARTYIKKGLYDKAKEILEKYFSDFSDNPEIRRWMAQNYLEQGKYDLALVEVEKAFFLDPTNSENFIIKGHIHVLRGEFNIAEEEYQKILELQDDNAFKWRGISRLTRLYVLLGKFEKAKNLNEQGIELTEAAKEYRWKSDFHTLKSANHLILGNYELALKDSEMAWESAEIMDDFGRLRRALYRKGRVYIEMGSIEEAQRTSEDLRSLIEEGMNKKTIRLHHHLIGMIEAEKGNYSKAIEYFTDAVALFPGGPLSKRADFIASLAEAHYEAGNLEAARQEYTRITALTTGRESFGRLYVIAFYMLGKIDEEQGNTAKAIENYEKFLDLWKEADPIFPEIEDAKERLKSLQN
jgi:tetratricopeptide (TPR) repeat protein/TolB-like protein